MPSIAPEQATTDIRRKDERRDTTEALLRDAALLLNVAGIERSPSWLSRTVRAYVAAPIEGLPFGLFLAAKVQMNAVQRRRVAEHADTRYLLSYADPTGETAIRNVMREQSRAEHERLRAEEADSRFAQRYGVDGSTDITNEERNR